MAQTPPGYGPPAGYEPPAGYPPPSQFGPPAQPPRRGRPWWVWALAGCGGCAALGVLAAIIVVVAAFSQYNSVKTGPITQSAIQQALGDVPVYPGATLDPTTTEITLKTLRLTEKAMGRTGQMFQGAGVFRTTDDPAKVTKFYDEKLKANGWELTSSQNTGLQEQHQYRKNGQMALVQIQSAGGQGTIVTLIRPGPERTRHGNRGRSSPGE